MSLRFVRLPSLAKHVIRDADLAHVVQVPRQLRNLHVCLRESQMGRDLDRIDRDLRRVSTRVCIAGVNRDGQRTDRAFERVLQGPLLPNEVAGRPGYEAEKT